MTTIHPILVSADTPYIITILVAAVGTLFGALGKVALVLLQRTDKAHAEVIAQYELRLAASEQRGNEWREMALREHHVTKDAVTVAVAKGGGGK